MDCHRPGGEVLRPGRFLEGRPIADDNDRGRPWGAIREAHRSRQLSKLSRVIAAGAVLIGAGIFVVLRQIATAPPNPQLGGLGQWVVGTQFPGPILICAGGLLWLVAALMGP